MRQIVLVSRVRDFDVLFIVFRAQDPRGRLCRFLLQLSFIFDILKYELIILLYLSLSFNEDTSLGRERRISDRMHWIWNLVAVFIQVLYHSLRSIYPCHVKRSFLVLYMLKLVWLHYWGFRRHSLLTPPASVYILSHQGRQRYERLYFHSRFQSKERKDTLSSRLFMSFLPFLWCNIDLSKV